MLRPTRVVAHLPVSALLETLKDDVAEVRAAAASTLGALNDPYAIDPLVRRLDDESEAVQQESAKALGRLTGQGFGEDRARWKRWWAENQPTSCGY